jgi:hypothetical protein
VSHGASLTAFAVGEKLYAPKLSPAIVTLDPPDAAALAGAAALTTGASKVNQLKPFVPTTLPTETFEDTLLLLDAAPIRHCTVVPDDQDVVSHGASLTAFAVGEKLYAPKLSPAIVTVAPPVCAALRSASELTTGASKLHPAVSRVPTTAATVTTARVFITAALFEPTAQPKVVLDVHDVVLHAS